MSKNILDNLFNSRVRVKVLRYLFRNYPTDFDIRELSRRVQEPAKVVKQELKTLLSLGLIKKKR